MNDKSTRSLDNWIPVWKRSYPVSRIQKADELQSARPVSFADAQYDCNFVVVQPSWLPADCRITSTFLRPEQRPGRVGIGASVLSQTPHSENNPSSLRIEIVGASRSLRIKEFFYDWTPPTAGTAPLWNTPWLTSANVGDIICHFGIDYKGNRGACAQMGRTQIELSVTDGTFDTHELHRIVTHLEDSNPALANIVKETPFHDLSYFVRHKAQGISSPYGLFMYESPRRYDVSQMISQEESVFNGIADRVNASVPFGYIHDSSIQMIDETMHHFEDESIFRCIGNRNDHLWMVCMGDESPFVFPEKPQVYENHPKDACEEISLLGNTVHVASVSRRFGGHEAIWRHGNRSCAIWTSPSDLLDYVTFRDRLIPAIISGLDLALVRGSSLPRGDKSKSDQEAPSTLPAEVPPGDLRHPSIESTFL